MPMPGDQHRDTAATTNPFVEQKPKINDYTAQEIATLQSRLEKQLGPEYISTRPGAGGGKVHYLAAEKVINLANEVFGFNGWCSEIKNVQIDFVDENGSGKITLGLSTIVRVTLRDGTFHEDIGYGHIENCKGKAAAFEKAKKEAATDAMKRALRNFGNVLGNCLYDKDYLQKVTKVKVAPSKWDADNLHRHPDFAPIKREAIADAGLEMDKSKSSAAQRQTSVQSNASFGTIEFEDEFGGIDDTDFTHPDEIQLEDSSTGDMSAKRAIAAPQTNVAQQRQGVSRVQSLPHMRPPNIQPPPPMQNLQGPSRPQGPPRPPNNAVQVPLTRPVPPPFAGNHQGPGQPAPATVQNHAGNGPRLNPFSNTATDSATNNVPQQRQPTPQNHANGDQLDDKGLPVPRAPPPGIPEGFMTGRGVEMLNQPPGTRPPNAALAFNPHADSPSIRRTHGVNPGKSAPVMRSSVGGGAPVVQAGSVAGAASQQQQNNGFNGAAAPVRTNFVNPAADMNRRIGMPPSAAVPNRGAFKPQTPLKRPPLTDVSNLPPQVDGAGETKKPKLDEQLGTEPVNGGTEAEAPAAT